MRAVWYERQGPASEVLQVGDLAAPEPGPGEVRSHLWCGILGVAVMVVGVAVVMFNRQWAHGFADSTCTGT